MTVDYSETFKKMRDIGRHAAICLDMLEEEIYPGISTVDIEERVKTYAMRFDLICAPYNYKGFPAYCCTSVNSVVCHGIPSDKKILKDGDIVKVDVTFKDKEGYHGDSCRTYAVGKIPRKAERLIEVTKEALTRGIQQCIPGNPIGLIGQVIQHYVESEGFSTVRDFVGHGIGQNMFHGKPNIYHYYDASKPEMSVIMEPGMIFTIEPMINAGKADVKIKKDGWTVVSKDHSLSAQFEHTIGITNNVLPVVFTRSGE